MFHSTLHESTHIPILPFPKNLYQQIFQIIIDHSGLLGGTRVLSLWKKSNDKQFCSKKRFFHPSINELSSYVYVLINTLLYLNNLNYINNIIDTSHILSILIVFNVRLPTLITHTPRRSTCIQTVQTGSHFMPLTCTLLITCFSMLRRSSVGLLGDISKSCSGKGSWLSWGIWGFLAIFNEVAWSANCICFFKVSFGSWHSSRITIP